MKELEMLMPSVSGTDSKSSKSRYECFSRLIFTVYALILNQQIKIGFFSHL